jgi:hypothetical protein
MVLPRLLRRRVELGGEVHEKRDPVVVALFSLLLTDRTITMSFSNAT